MRFDFATRQTEQVGLITPRALLGEGSLTISGEERWALYSERDGKRTDLMLVENFR